MVDVVNETGVAGLDGASSALDMFALAARLSFGCEGTAVDFFADDPEGLKKYLAEQAPV